jgi:rubrerythrin
MESGLLDLFARLSRSSARNRLYAMRARKDNRPQLARLFLALADSQAMQARRFLMQIRGAVGPTEENEHTVFVTELPEAINEYMELLAEAEQAGSKALATAFRHSADVDRLILELHGKVTEQGQEADYYVCDFCGHVATHEPPDNCPICTAPKNRFNKVEAG